MDKLRFTVDSALLSELGEKLVERVHIALLELVKNSYDADATKVTVSMVPQENTYDIHVTDNGVGMSLDQVKRYWMRIATTNKVAESISPIYGRKKSGAKGIGRFSCRRLGTKLSLNTTALLDNGRYETTTLNVDWEQYQPGTDVTEITCDGHTKRSSTGSTGTKLIVTGGRPDEWSQRGWGFLKRRLIQLVSNQGSRRRGFKADPGFNISLEAPDFEESAVTDPREQLMNAGWGRLQLTVGKDGKAEWALLAKRLGHKQLTLPERYPDLAGTTADITILPDRKNHFRNPKVIGMELLRETLADWGGVHIRVDGMRIPPYGENHNDWLGIDRDRGVRKGPSKYSPVKKLAEKLRGVTEGRELLNLLSARSHLGDVNISSTPGLFEMKASREGLVGEKGINLLRDIVRQGIDWSTVYRDYYLRLEDEDNARQAREEFAKVVEKPIRAKEVIESAASYVQQEIRQVTAHLPATERRQVVKNVAKATTAMLNSDKLQREELRHLRLIASTSSLLLIFSHEVRSLLSVLDEYKMRLSLLKRGLSSKHKKQADEMRDSFDFTKERFSDLLDMTSFLAIDSRTATDKPLALKSRVTKAASCFRLITHNYDIDIDLDGIPSAIKLGAMLEAELYSILLNGFSNAIKSVIASGKRKRIAVTARKADGGVWINIMDTGLGVPENWEELFTPFIVDPDGTLYRNLKQKLNPEDEHVVGTGSGLGLSIVKEIVETHSGTVQFAEPTERYMCNLEIFLP